MSCRIEWPTMVTYNQQKWTTYIQKDIELVEKKSPKNTKKLRVDHERNMDEGGQTALMCAAQAGKLELVQELLQRGADVKAVDEDKWTPLVFAAKEGHVDIVKSLLDKGGEIDHTDVNGWTALMWASYKGHVEVVDELLERGAFPNVQAHHGVTPIIWAAGRGHTQVVESLLKHGAKANSADKYGTTGLVWAARKGHVGCVKALLENGANVDIAGMNSWTALIVASRGGYREVVEMLLGHKPNINAVDKEGMTGLCCAAREGHAEVVELLLTQGAYVNVQDKHGDTVLIHAVKGGHLDVVKLLLDKYADVDVQGHDKKTALFWAADRGLIDILEAILECNPNTELANKDGETPLLRATRNRNREVVRILLDKNAKVSAVDKRGDTPLHIAIRFRDKKVSELLLRNPKDGRLLYKPNRDGDTPYNIDCNHQKGILTQIFGARSFTPGDEMDGEVSDLCSSSLADILSEPTLVPPVTVGIYARWGSGKSFILKKLQEEMKQFTTQDTRPTFQFSCLSVILCVLISAIVCTISWAQGSKPIVAAGLALAVFLMLLLAQCLVYFGNKKKWRGMPSLSTWLARQLNYLRLLLSIAYRNPPTNQPAGPRRATKVLPIKFMFAEHLRLTSIAGETPLAKTLCSLTSEVEKEVGTLASRLYRVVRTKPVEGKPKCKRVCCIPRFLITIVVLVCFLTGIFLKLNVEDHTEYDNTTIAMFVMVGIVGLAFLLNIVNIVRLLYHLVWSPHVRITRASNHGGQLRTENFLRVLKNEADTFAGLVRCVDSFQGTSTRLVIIVDGLDSCEQELVLHILDSIKTLFSSQDSPYITILAIDPYIIAKAVDQNLHTVFKESNIRGHDYLRNIVHLPFYLEVGIKLKDEKETASTNHITPSGSKASATPSTPQQSPRPVSGLPSIPELPENESTSNSANSKPSENSAEKPSANSKPSETSSENPPVNAKPSENSSESPGNDKPSSNGKTKEHDLAGTMSSPLLGKQSSRDSDQGASASASSPTGATSLPITTPTQGSSARYHTAKDVSQLLSSDEQFSDLSPRSMRRLLNIVSITGRLLRAHSINFNWQTLAKWINMTEKWPYRMSRIILYYQDNEDGIDDECPLRVLYDNIAEEIPLHREVEPLLELDQDQRSFAVYLTKHTPVLTAGDLRRFLPCTCNLDPYLRKQIRDSLESAETTGTLPNLSRPQSFGSGFPIPQSSKGSYGGLSDTPSKISYQMAAQNPFNKKQLPSPLISAGTPSHSFLTVKDVCDRLLTLDGLDKHAIPRYQTRIAEHNINGYVLLQCQLDELKEVLGMTFGDWQLFKNMVLQMRGQSCSCAQTPSVSSSDPLQMDTQSGGVPEGQLQAPGDYLNLSFEELRKTNTMSTHRSSQSLHNSRVSLGTSQSESSRANSASETDETSVTGYSQRPGSTGNLLNRMDESTEEDDGVDREGITQFTAIAADGDYRPPMVLSSADDIELTTVVVHLENSPTDKEMPNPLSPNEKYSALEYQLSPEEPSTSTASDTTVIRVPVGDQNGDSEKGDEREDKFRNGNHKHGERKLSGERKSSFPGAIAGSVGKIKAKLRTSRESLERDETEGQPLLPPEETEISDPRRYNLGAECQGAEAMPLMPHELDVSVSKSLSELEEERRKQQAEGNIISPIMKAQVVRDIDRMFENLQLEISQKQSQLGQMDTLSPERGETDPGRIGRIPRSPVQGEQQSHDLSLLAGYSTFNPPVRELQSVPETETLSSSDEKSTPGSDKPRYQRTPLARQSQSTDLYQTEGDIQEPSLMRTTSQPNRFSDSSVGFQQRQLQQSSSRTLDQSFDEFIMLSLEEQRKRRAPNPNAPHEEVERRPGRGTTTSSRYAFLRRSAPSLALQSMDGNAGVFTVNISDTDSSDSGQVTQQAHI